MIIKTHHLLQVCSYSYWNWRDIHHTIAAMNMSHMTRMEVELDLPVWLLIIGAARTSVQSPQVGFHRLTKNVMPPQIVLLYVTCFFATCHGTTPVLVTLYDTHFHMLRHPISDFM